MECMLVYFFPPFLDNAIGGGLGESNLQELTQLYIGALPLDQIDALIRVDATSVY